MSLRGMQPFSESRARYILCELCEQSSRVETLSSSVLCQELCPDEMGKVTGESDEDR
jgi:hypothetical protein